MEKKMSLELDAMGWSVAEGHTGRYPFQVRLRQFETEFPRAVFRVG